LPPGHDGAARDQAGEPRVVDPVGQEILEADAGQPAERRHPLRLDPAKLRTQDREHGLRRQRLLAERALHLELAREGGRLVGGQRVQQAFQLLGFLVHALVIKRRRPERMVNLVRSSSSKG